MDSWGMPRGPQPSLESRGIGARNRTTARGPETSRAFGAGGRASLGRVSLLAKPGPAPADRSSRVPSFPQNRVPRY